MQKEFKEQWLQSLHYSVRRYFVDRFHFLNTTKIPAGSSVLDVGGHKEGGRGQFSPQMLDWNVLCLNIDSSNGADIIGSAEEMPMENDQFDAVICSEVMEHVRFPRKVLNECYRVLKKDGVLYATVPFLYREHADPCDYGRYTEYFWRENLKEIGYRDVLLERHGDFHLVIVDMLKQYLNDRQFALWKKRFMKKFLLCYQAWAIKRFFSEKESGIGKFERSFTTGFGIVAKK